MGGAERGEVVFVCSRLLSMTVTIAFLSSFAESGLVGSLLVRGRRRLGCGSGLSMRSGRGV